MSFFTDVQKGRVSAPVHKSYSQAKWETAYAENRATLDCDRIFAAGSIIFRILESLRKANSDIPKWCDTEKHVRYLIGLSNRDTVVLAIMARDFFRNVPNPFMNDLEHFKVPLNTGQMAKPDEITTSAVDSLSTVIPDVLSNSKTAIVAGLSDLEKLQCLAIQLNLCNTYQWVESVWRDCLWNGYGFDDDGDSGFYIRPYSEVARAVAEKTAVTSYRRKMYQTNLVGLLAEMWQSDFDDVTKAKLARIDFVTAIVGSGKTRSIQVSTGKNDQPADKSRFEAFSTKDLVQKEFYKEILSTPISQLEGETVAKLFEVWLVLRSLSRACAERSTDASVYSPNTLLTFSSSFPRKEVIGLIARTTKLSIKSTKAILEFLTFRERRHTLWTQPLVEVSDDRLALPFAALHQSEPLYVLESWLPMLSINVGAKGNPFEHEVRKSLIESDKSPFLEGIFTVFSDEFTFHPNSRGERNEEIDLIFLINKTLFIGEIKCSVVPVESIDFYNNRSILAGATDQALRKSANVRRNLEAFIKQLKSRGFNIPADVVIKPIVVSNNLINSGYPVNDVPVVDVPIIERYLEGSLTELSYKAGLEPIVVTKFYQSSSEAESSIDAYLRNPPQLRHIKYGLRSRELDLPVNLFDEDLPRLRTCSYEVIVNVEDVKRRIAAVEA